MHTRLSLHKTITQHIINAMKHAKSASVPWLQNNGLPHNAISQQCYRGINILHLWITARKKYYTSPTWATYAQWHALGAQVKKGEKGTNVIFYQRVLHDDDGNEKHRRFNAIMKCSTVFNAQQVNGYEECQPVQTAPLEAVQIADSFVNNTNAVIQHGGDRAYYTISSDAIVMPDKTLFVGSKTSTPTEAYYAVLLHELTHWTGHANRCNRLLKGSMAKESYAMEELVAELGAAFLCAELGITATPRQDHADYLANWISALEYNEHAIFSAAGMATAAVAYLHALQPPK